MGVNEEVGVYFDETTQKWIAQVPTGERYSNGRIKYRKASADTEKEALQKEKDIMVELELIKAKLNSLIPEPEKEKTTRLFKIAAEEWIEKAKTEPSPFNNRVITHITWKRYNSIIKNHLIPKFGHLQVDSITEDKVRQHLSLRKSQSDKRQHFFVIRNILRAEEQSLGDMKAPAPGSDKEIGCIKDPDELKIFINGLKGTELYYPSLLMGTTGLSVSETAGLKWSDIDLKRNFLTVNRSLHWTKERKNARKWFTKDTKRSSRRRTISVDPVTIKELEKLKKKTNAKNNDFVFLYNNEPIHGAVFTKKFTRVASELGYDITPHGLRHSHATILIMIYGVDPKTVSRRLGHADVGITLRVYSAFIPQNDLECANIMNDIFAKNTPEIHSKE